MSAAKLGHKAPSRRAALRARLGFTLVEVMVSLGVMTIGAVAVIGMQQQTTRGNVQAREITVATQIAQNWIERLKMDSTLWRDSTGNPTADLANTIWLNQIASNGGEGAFRTLASATMPATMSNGFDYYGADAPTTDATAMANVRYCASFRMSWIQSDRVMRVDVRVWWPWEPRAVDMATDFIGCVDNNTLLNPTGAAYGRYHTVYLSTSLRNFKVN